MLSRAPARALNGAPCSHISISAHSRRISTRLASRGSAGPISASEQSRRIHRLAPVAGKSTQRKRTLAGIVQQVLRAKDARKFLAPALRSDGVETQQAAIQQAHMIEPRFEGTGVASQAWPQRRGSSECQRARAVRHRES